MKLSSLQFSGLYGALGGLAKCLTIAAPVLVISFAPSSAQEVAQSHLDAAKAAISSTGTSGPLDNILPIMAQRTKSQLISDRPDIASTISDIVDDAAISLAPRRGDLETEVATIYAKVFSEEELKAIAEFYLSDAGKKLLTEAPVLERQIKNASRTWSAGVQRDMAQVIGKKLQELEKKPTE